MRATDTKHKILEERYLPRQQDAPQFMEVHCHVPIMTDRVTHKNFQWIVHPELRWEPSLGCFAQTLIRIEGETGFHIHRCFAGICYRCGHQFTPQGQEQRRIR